MTRSLVAAAMVTILIVLPRCVQGVNASTSCLCVFDVDRTLTASQGSAAKCPGTREVKGIYDTAYARGTLVLSAFSAAGIKNTFCGQCYLGVVTAGDLSGPNSKMRAYFLKHVLVTDLQEVFARRVRNATTWSSGKDVSSPLVVHQQDGTKQIAVAGIVDWYKKQGPQILEDQVFFFDDRQDNVQPFAGSGFNSKQISCTSRDHRVIGLCGARPEEITSTKGVEPCKRLPQLPAAALRTEVVV